MPRKRTRSAFGRIFQRKGRQGFYVRVRINGREVERYAGQDRRTAQELLGELLRAHTREELFGERSVPSVTFREFQKTLLQHFAARHAPSTLASETGRLGRVVRWFAETPIKDVTPGDIQAFLSQLRTEEGHSVASANRYASLLSTAFKTAIEHGLAVRNPVSGIRRPKEEVRPVPFLTAEDVDRLVEHATASDPRFGTLVRVLSDTGMRRAEALSLEWRDVDLERGVLLVRRSKSKRPRQIELTSTALSVLRWLNDQKPPVPFSGPHLVWPEWSHKCPQSVSSRFKTIAKRAGFPTLTLHGLRHGFCSRLAQANVPLPTISALAGHTAWQTTQRYASHLPEGATRAAIVAMESHGKGAKQGAKAADGSEPSA